MKAKLVSLLSAIIIFLFSRCTSQVALDQAPAMPGEVVLNRWSPDHVWIHPHYVFKNGKHVKVMGYYEYRPRHKSKWVAAHIRKTPRGKVWIEDRWE